MYPGNANDSRHERIPVVDLHTVRELLRMKSALEPGAHSSDDAEGYWFELLRGHSEADVFDAAWEHYRVSPRPLWPTDVLQRVTRLETGRTEAASTARSEILQNQIAEPYAGEWMAIFDEETARGAPVDTAMRTADACSRTSTKKPPQTAAELSKL